MILYFCKQGYERLCPVNKFAKDLKDDHALIEQFSTEITLKYLHQT